MEDIRSRSVEKSTNVDAQQVSERSSYASNLCVILTRKCNARCRHCINSCSPFRAENLDENLLESFILQAAESGYVSSIGFSGGEPFLDTARLERAVALCKRHGLDTTVATNAFWASSVSMARNVLQKVEGLVQVCLSTDEFHQEFVPLDRVTNAILACCELGIQCIITITYLKDNLAQTERIQNLLKDVEDLYKIKQWPVVPGGRALTEIKRCDFFTYDLSNAVCVSADSPTLNVNGDLTACCGPAGQWPRGHRLQLDSLSQRSLKDILEAGDRDPVIQAIRIWGPAWLLDLAMSHAPRGGVSLDAGSAIDMCAICEYLFKDPARTELVVQSLQDKQILRELAVARMARLGEVSMFLNLDQTRNGTT